MPVTSEDADRASVTTREAQDALTAILADENFVASERTRSLLRYLGDEALQGRSDRVKAYTIAIDFLGRPASFDSTIDPIVRVEASRLRSALHTYNQSHFNADGIRVDLPKGGYIPTFTRTQNPESPLRRAPIEPLTPRETIRHPFPGWSQVTVGMLSVALAGAALFYLQLGSRPRIAARPILEITTESRGDTSIDLTTARIEFERAAMAQETIRLAGSGLPTGPAGGARVIRSNYLLNLISGQRASQPIIRWRLASIEPSETLATGEELVQPSIDAGVEHAMQTIARKVASVDGVIPISELVRATDGDIGYPCILRAQQAMAARNTGALKSARLCLEKTLDVSDRYADAHAALGTLLMFLSRVSGEPRDLDLGLIHADRAAALAPASAQAAVAQAVTRYQAGQLSSAVSAARRAVEMGASNPAVLSRASAVIYLGGQWEEGLSVAKTALSQAGAMKPTGANLVLMLDAYRNGEYELAIQRVDSVSKPDPVAVLVKLSALFKLGRQRELAATYKAAQNQYPDFEKVLTSVAAGNRFEQTLMDGWREPLIEVGQTYGSIPPLQREAVIMPQ